MKKRLTTLILIMVMFIAIIPTNTFAASKPAKPTISSVTAVSTTSIKIKWKKAKDVDGYVIYQKKSSGKYKKVKTITQGTTTTYTKTKLSSGTKYSYKIKAYKKSNNKKLYSSYSKAKTCYTIKKNFKAKILSLSATKNSITIKWKKVKGANGYEIYQKESNGKYKKIKTVTSGSILKYKKSNLSINTKYTYKIRAYKKSGDYKIFGSFSDIKSKKTKKQEVQSYASSEAIGVFLEYIKSSANNQTYAIKSLTSYIQTYDQEYITYFYDFINLAYTAGSGAYEMSLIYTDMQPMSYDINASNEILAKIANGSYTYTELSDMLEESITHLSNVLNMCKDLAGM